MCHSYSGDSVFRAKKSISPQIQAIKTTILASAYYVKPSQLMHNFKMPLSTPCSWSEEFKHELQPEKERKKIHIQVVKEHLLQL